MRLALALLCCTALACTSLPARAPDDSGAGIDALNARLADAYRQRDPEAYARLFTDTAAFEWPAFDTPRGRPALAGMVRANWAAQRDVELRLRVATRRLAADHATELGAFEQSWTDSAGVRRTEYGRYVTLLARQGDGRWLIDRFLGFADSTRVVRSTR